MSAGLRETVAHLLWCANQGYLLASDRDGLENMFTADPATLHAGDRAELPGWLEQADAVLAALPASEQFVIEYDYRSDMGPQLVGPFPSRDAAQAHADSLAGPGWEASFCICPLASPAASTRGDDHG